MLPRAFFFLSQSFLMVKTISYDTFKVSEIVSSVLCTLLSKTNANDRYQFQFQRFCRYRILFPLFHSQSQLSALVCVVKC